MSMFLKDEKKSAYLKKILAETTEKEDSTDVLSDVSIEKLKKLGFKFDQIKDPIKTH
jgi:Holliday junction resolvasome RuvABC DNA-binding subunit